MSPGRRVLVPIAQTASLLGAARLGNQGLFVRPGAVRWWCGLLFGTRSEVAVAQALEAAGACFFPLAAARLTADTGARMTREADFLVVQDGVVGILELDGRPHDRRAADDHARDRAFKRHGIWVVERVPSAEALADPAGVVLRFLGMLRYYRRTA
ncbi:hypothetical protein tb265_07090 [Gemmatimonadetes bacterium T265]|nr:hypothetical protein tb265_07090 [Gemmatimonadetes bacterium T265]